MHSPDGADVVACDPPPQQRLVLWFVGLQRPSSMTALYRRAASLTGFRRHEVNNGPKRFILAQFSSCFRQTPLTSFRPACNVEEVVELEPCRLCRLPGQILGLWGSRTLWMLFTGPSVFHRLCIFQSLAAPTTCQVRHLVWGDALWSLTAPLRGHINGRDDKSEQ